MRGWQQSHIDKLHSRGMVVNQPSTLKQSSLLLSKVRSKMKHNESDLQIRCVETFRLVYPKLKLRLFAVPNGGYRNSMEAARMVKEGICHGCSDLILAVPKNGFGAMFIEIKTTTGRLSDYQNQFIEEMQSDYRCVVCRSVEEFLKEIKEYLK